MNGAFVDNIGGLHAESGKLIQLREALAFLGEAEYLRFRGKLGLVFSTVRSGKKQEAVAG